MLSLMLLVAVAAGEALRAGEWRLALWLLGAVLGASLPFGAWAYSHRLWTVPMDTWWGIGLLFLQELRRDQANKRHLLEVKSSRRKRKLSRDQPVAGSDLRQVKKLLGR
mgnify:CR=1 FL=1